MPSEGFSKGDLALLLTKIGGDLISGIGASRSRRKDRETEEKLTRERIDADERGDLRDLAFKESLENPFRQQLAQAKTIGKLDMMERARLTPARVTPHAAYASSVPTVSGGFSYEQSPELIASAGMLKRNVIGGNVAPSMTNPQNYGRTAALNLPRVAADNVDPAKISAATASVPGSPRGTAPTTDYLTDVPRRGGSVGSRVGGAAGGASMGATIGSFLPGAGTAVGAGLGALIGLLGKRAKSAGTDLDVGTARQVLERAIQEQTGRAPQPGEIDAMLAGQGLKPGDRWVGEAGMRSLLASLQQRRDAAADLQPSYSYIGVG